MRRPQKAEYDRPQQCCVCHRPMTATRTSWLFRCLNCGYLQSTLAPRIRDKDAQAAIDEGLREKALGSLRVENFEKILDRLATCRPQIGGQLLDVGCAHGWFLQAAEARGYCAVGIEPDPVIYNAAKARGLHVWNGYFPQDIPDERRFDVITFNDVLEHLPTPGAMIESCRQRLNPGGNLVINIPCSRGAFYRLARLFNRLGFSSLFDRMWQLNFASPHISYFTPEQLVQLTAKSGFREIHRSALRAVNVRDLWARLRYDRESSVAMSGIVFVVAAALMPFLDRLPADINLQIFLVDASKRAGQQ